MQYCSRFSCINVTYSLADRNESSVQDPCLLPSGYFTWVVTADNQFTFGLMQNTLEWGTKHIALANGRAVYAAGELTVTASPTTIQWNLNSGTYNGQLNSTTSARMVQVWNVSSCAIRYTSSAVSVRPPSAKYMGEVCDQLVAHNQTSRLMYRYIPVACSSRAGSVCPDNYAQCSSSALGTPIAYFYGLLRSVISELLFADAA